VPEVREMKTDDEVASTYAVMRQLRLHLAEEGCGRLQLDSGVQRADAQRFYFREGMSISAYHFSKGV